MRKIIIIATAGALALASIAIAQVGGSGVSAFMLRTPPTTVGLLPACNASNEGSRAYVTDQNTGVAYRGAVTGTGSTRQAVLCSNNAWIQD